MIPLEERECAVKCVVIGASAGALDALMKILPVLPHDFQPSTLIVVHIPPDKNNILPKLFENKCSLRLHEAGDKEPIESGHVYFAPPDYHMLVEKSGVISLSSEEPVLFSRPSIDVLFETAADVYRDNLIGIVLTGANEDGAKGLRAVIDAGGIGLIQDPSQSHMSTMPLSAYKLCPEAHILTLEEITQYLQRAGR